MTAFPEVPEAHIAVGSLSGIAPSDIKAHVLIVLTRDGQLGVTGNTCDHLGMAVTAKALSMLADRVNDDHDHGIDEIS